MIDNILDLPIHQDIFDIYQRNDYIEIQIYNKKFLLTSKGSTRTMQPFELLKFISSVNSAKLGTIQTIPNNPVNIGEIIGTVLVAQIRTYKFNWGHSRLTDIFGAPKYISKKYDIHNMSNEEIANKCYGEDNDEVQSEPLSKYYKIYGDIRINPVLPLTEFVYSCNLFQPEFLLINGSTISSGGFIHSAETYDFTVHAFKEKYPFHDITLISEPTNTYGSGKLCIQNASNISEAIHNYYNDVYNTDLMKPYFNTMVQMQYKFANEKNTNTAEFFHKLNEIVNVNVLNLDKYIKNML